MRLLDEGVLIAAHGIEGDRTAQRAGGKRQVTLFQWEHLPVLAALQGLGAVAPEALRRNLGVAGVNLRALVRQRFRVGPCLLEGTGECHPCRKMEVALGDGGYASMRGHGGINAVVLEGGPVALGDAVRIASDGGA
jgi:MOSC domain-containing protein YiiM